MSPPVCSSFGATYMVTVLLVLQGATIVSGDLPDQLFSFTGTISNFSAYLGTYLTFVLLLVLMTQHQSTVGQAVRQAWLDVQACRATIGNESPQKEYASVGKGKRNPFPGVLTCPVITTSIAIRNLTQGLRASLSHLPAWGQGSLKRPYMYSLA